MNEATHTVHHFVRSRFFAGGKSPVIDNFVALVNAEDGVRVAYIDYKRQGVL